MKKKIKKIVDSFFMILFGIIKIVLYAIASIWNSCTHRSVWFAIFYQTFLVLINLALLFYQIKDAIQNSDTCILLIILIAIEFLGLTFAENTVIELIYHLRNRTANYETLQKLQQYCNNYALLIISLAALFVGAFPSDSEDANLGLFVFGVLYFLATICSDAYRIFISEKGVVMELAARIKEIWIDD